MPGAIRRSLGKRIATAGMLGLALSIGAHGVKDAVGDRGCEARYASAAGCTSAAEDAAIYIDKHVSREHVNYALPVSYGLSLLGIGSYASGAAAERRSRRRNLKKIQH